MGSDNEYLTAKPQTCPITSTQLAKSHVKNLEGPRIQGTSPVGVILGMTLKHLP